MLRLDLLARALRDDRERQVGRAMRVRRARRELRRKRRGQAKGRRGAGAPPEAMPEARGAAHDAPPTKGALAVIVAAVFMVVLSDNVINIVLPKFVRVFHSGVAQVGWTVTGYALVLAVAVPLYGRASDFLSVRRVFSFALPVFAAGSAISALAPNLGVLVLGRIVQGAGAAGIPALASVAVAKMLPPGKRGAAFGAIGSSVGAAAAAGPVIGGVVGEYLGWRILFAALVALSLALYGLSRAVLPAEEGRRSAGFDIPGGLFLGGTVGLLLLSVTNAQGQGVLSPAVGLGLLGSMVSLMAFVWRIRTAPSPFVATELFRNRRYLVILLVTFDSSLVGLWLLVFVPLVVVQVAGLSSAQAGLVLVPGALAMALVSPRAGRWSDRVGARPLILLGLALEAGAALVMSTFGAGGPVVGPVVAVFIGDVGFAFLNAPLLNAAAAALADEDIGAGLGIYRTAFFIGAGVGPSAFGAFLSTRVAQHAAAVNPLYRLGAPAYSDLFLLIATLGLSALIVVAVALPRAGVGSTTIAGPVRPPGPRPGRWLRRRRPFSSLRPPETSLLPPLSSPAHPATECDDPES